MTELSGVEVLGCSLSLPPFPGSGSRIWILVLPYHWHLTSVAQRLANDPDNQFPVALAILGESGLKKSSRFGN